MIRQALATSASRSTNIRGQEHQELTDEIVSALTKVLKSLLPSARDTETFAAEIVQKAVSLKNAWAEAHVVYSFFWVSSGMQYDPTRIHTTGGIQGKVCMCTFPGMAQTVEPGNETVVVVKANAFLNSK